MQKFIPNFLEEVMPYVYSIHLNFISKKTKKTITTPPSASTKVRNFFLSRGLRSYKLDSCHIPQIPYWESIHIYKTMRQSAVIRDISILPDIVSNKTRCIRLPYGYFPRGTHEPAREGQKNRLDYIVSGQCNRELKTAFTNEKWDVECFLMAEVYYSATNSNYKYTGYESKVLVILGTEGTQMSRFTPGNNIIIEKIIL